MNGETIYNMRVKRSKLFQQAEGFRREHTLSDGMMSEDDEAVYERLSECVKIMDKAIEDKERRMALETMVLLNEAGLAGEFADRPDLLFP